MDRQDILCLLPRAISWAEAQSRRVASKGQALSPAGCKLAREVGVAQPESVRIALVDSLPMPDDPALRDAAEQTGLLGPGMYGLTLGYAVFICRGHETTRLLSHELRHVHQYERAGSIADFLPVYIQQIVDSGYYDAPLEQDARLHEWTEPNT